MNSHELATDLDRQHTNLVYIRINGKLYEVGGCCDDYDDEGNPIIILGNYEHKDI